MRPIEIDFGWSPRSVARIAGILMLVAAVAGMGALAWTWFELRAESDRWQADRRRLDRLASDPAVKEPPENRERLLTELRLANRVIDKLDTPWDALFGAIETTAGEQAILLGVEPDAERREVRLTAEAKNAAAMLDYLRELRRAPTLRDAHLTGHQINVQDPQRPLRFTINARWVEPPPIPKAAVDTLPAEVKQ